MKEPSLSTGTMSGKTAAYTALLGLGVLFDVFPFSWVSQGIRRAHLSFTLPWLEKRLKEMTGQDFQLFLRRGAASRSKPVYNPFFSDLDIGIVVQDLTQADRIAASYHQIRRKLIFLGELEIYSVSEFKKLTQLSETYGELYDLMRDGRKAFWLRGEARQAKRARRSFYHRYKTLRAMRQVLAKSGLARPHHRYQPQIKALWEAVRCEFQVLFPALSETVQFSCPYLSRNFRLSADTPDLNDVLLLLACTPVSERGNPKIDSLIQRVRRSHPGIEAVFVALNEMEYIFMSAFKRGVAKSEGWHQSWLDALQRGQQPVAAEPFCQDTVSRVRVTSEGNVFFCSYQRTFPIGNLLKDSFESVWNSSLAKEIRFATQTGLMHKTCQKSACPHAYRERTRTADGYSAPEWPVYLDIDPPNTHCNIGGSRPDEKNPACLMCERSLLDYRFEEDRSADVLPKLGMLMPHIRHLHIQGVAEVFWRELIFDYLERIGFQQHKSAITVSTYSNGISFDRQMQAKWLEAVQNSVITFSIDAATPETYQRIRRQPEFHRVQENIRNYSTLTQAFAGSHTFRIAHNINTLNVGEVCQMVEFAASVGAQEIAFDVTGGHPQEILLSPENEHLFRRAEEEIRETAHRLSQKVFWVRPFRWVGA
ncbi:MAG: SPASM domain-containing protein [Bdellovibrionia bacterium]